jgi:hypothetical protein
VISVEDNLDLSTENITQHKILIRGRGIEYLNDVILDKHMRVGYEITLRIEGGLCEVLFRICRGMPLGEKATI